MSVDLADLRTKKITALVQVAQDLGVDNAANLRKQELIFEIVRLRAGTGGARGMGILEKLPDGFGFLRSPDCNYLPGPDDIYVSPSQIRRFNLRTGDEIRGQVRAPKEGERYFALIKIEQINERSPETERNKLLFDNLTPIFPVKHLDFGDGPHELRLLDLFAPIALGQRISLLCPPRGGRTHLVSQIAATLSERWPNLFLMMLLIDERPEDVTEMQRIVNGEVLSSTFDESAARHVQVAEMAHERAKRLVEQGRDVIFFIDSLSRLARAYNASNATTGRVIPGQIEATAIHKTRRIFASGRNLEEGGSLTVIGTLMTETTSSVDALLLEELYGKANAEIALSSVLCDRGVFPPLDLARTKTHGLEKLVSTETKRHMDSVRATLNGDPAADIRRLLQDVQGSPSNKSMMDEFDKATGTEQKGLSV